MDKSGKNRKSHGEKSKSIDKNKVESQKHVKDTNSTIRTDRTSKTKIDSNVLSNELQNVLEISQKPIDKFRKREIQSNWSKYESPIEEDTSVATNFENLMNAPISTGGHFQFKSEKNLQVDLSNEFRDYFSLNINKLAKNLETLPFYERHGLDKSLFTNDEIKIMDSRCSNVEKECIDKITQILQKSDKPKYTINTENSMKKQEQEFGQKQSIVEDDLDELLDLKMPETEINASENTLDNIEEPELNISKLTSINSKTKLENWLDDLLQ